MKLLSGASTSVLSTLTVLLSISNAAVVANNHTKPHYHHHNNNIHHDNHTENYSTWMATSIISRNQGILSGTGDASELLQAGFTQKAFRALLQQYPEHASADQISSYIQTSVDSVITTVNNASASIKTSPLDRLSTGNNLITLYQDTSNQTYLDAFTSLRESIDLQPRNAEGGLWYYTYPNWSYLDGMASFAPFYTMYTLLYNDKNTSALPEDLLLQLDLLWQHCYNNETRLLVHGYDETKTAVWANNVTGASPHVWGRSLGWYTLALVDTLPLLPTNSSVYAPAVGHLKSRFKQLMTAVMDARDEVTGAWWQILDLPGRDGNYIESSGSAMFVYSLLKGLRLGYLDDCNNSTRTIAERAYEYTIDEFVVENGNGTLGYNGTVGVCSLNSTTSYEYYVTRPLVYNSVLGSAAFVLASIEYEALQK